MSLSDDARDKISPNPLVRNPTDVLIWAIIVIQIVVAIVVFPFLPAVVPIHWDANGQPNGYGSKWVASILWPGISLGLYVLMRVLTTISPRLGSRSSLAANAQVRQMLIAGIVLFLLVMQIVTTANILGMNIGMIFILNLAISVLFIFIGNYMGKLRPEIVGDLHCAIHQSMQFEIDHGLDEFVRRRTRNRIRHPSTLAHRIQLSSAQHHRQGDRAPPKCRSSLSVDLQPQLFHVRQIAPPASGREDAKVE